MRAAVETTVRFVDDDRRRARVLTDGSTSPASS
jgi:hypothetical protein